MHTNGNVLHGFHSFLNVYLFDFLFPDLVTGGAGVGGGEFCSAGGVGNVVDVFSGVGVGSSSMDSSDSVSDDVSDSGVGSVDGVGLSVLVCFVLLDGVTVSLVCSEELFLCFLFFFFLLIVVHSCVFFACASSTVLNKELSESVLASVSVSLMFCSVLVFFFVAVA